MQYYTAELNHFYLASPPLWQRDDSWDGFQWIDADNREASVLSYRRIGIDGKELLILLNFTPVVHEDFWLSVARAGDYVEVFNSDEERFGGSGVVNEGTLTSTETEHGTYVRLRLPPLAMTVIQYQENKKRNAQPKTKTTSKLP